LLRSLKKVSIEFGLLAIAHNIKKWWAKLQQGKVVQLWPPEHIPPDNESKIDPSLTKSNSFCFFVHRSHGATSQKDLAILLKSYFNKKKAVSLCI